MAILDVVEWGVWGTILACGVWFALGIRMAAVRRTPPPAWPTLVLALLLIMLPTAFLFLPYNKLHMLWLMVVLWRLSIKPSFSYVPVLSRLFIWPAYIYASLVIAGTGISLTSPARQSPWAARIKSPRRKNDGQSKGTSNIEALAPRADADAHEIAVELSEQLKHTLQSIPESLAVWKEKPAFNLRDVNEKIVMKELSILSYAGQRLAVQVAKQEGKGPDLLPRQEICSNLDQLASEYIDCSADFCELMNQRGGQYLRLLKTHIEEINNGEWKDFMDALRFYFVQFCRGGGAENSPVIIGNGFSAAPLQMLATEYWLNSFTKAGEVLRAWELKQRRADH